MRQEKMGNINIYKYTNYILWEHVKHVKPHSDRLAV